MSDLSRQRRPRIDAVQSGPQPCAGPGPVAVTLPPAGAHLPMASPCDDDPDRRSTAEVRGSEGGAVSAAAVAADPVSQAERRLKDYAATTRRLSWQRQGIYFGAFVLAVSYYSVLLGILCYWLILATEFFDSHIARQILAWRDHAPEQARRFSRLITVGTLLNAAAISLFILIATWMEGTSSHFTPLMFLFAAALFAAINTHQLLHVLILRLAIYAMVFLVVAAWNIVLTEAPPDSVHWLQFFTVAFVLFFILDCSFTFLRMYRRNLAQIDRLRHEREAAMAAFRAKSEFLSIVSHELRTPITSIKGPLNLITGGVLGEIPDSLRHMLVVANKNSNRLATLIDDLLDLQALEAGRMTMALEPIDIAALVAEAIEATTDYLKERRVTVHGSGLDRPAMVTGDGKRLMQVIVNILSNAIKFSHEDGRVEVVLATGTDEVRISVTDFGRGIPDGAEDQVFAAFTQVDSSDHRTVGGTGLGMSISRPIVERHGGTIGYQSRLGSGTTFHVVLPRHDVLAAPSAPEASA